MDNVPGGRQLNQNSIISYSHLTYRHLKHNDNNFAKEQIYAKSDLIASNLLVDLVPITSLLEARVPMLCGLGPDEKTVRVLGVSIGKLVGNMCGRMVGIWWELGKCWENMVAGSSI